MLSVVFGSAALAAFMLSSSLAVDKSKAIGPCGPNLWCPKGSNCIEQECYPNKPRFYSPARKLGTKSLSAIGPCVNGRCPNGYECVENECFRATRGAKTGAIGPCINNLCPNGYTCNIEEYQCYPSD